MIPTESKISRAQSVVAYHNEAMRIAQKAMTANPDKKRELSSRACRLEAIAAEMASKQPSKAVLFRSAAWLAIDAEDYPLSLELAAKKGLRGVRHDEIRHELIDVIKKAANLL